jgi:dTDP-glucose pyrophosphorylase
MNIREAILVGRMAQTLLLAENFASGNLPAVILGDNISEAKLDKYIDKFRKQKKAQEFF